MTIKPIETISPHRKETVAEFLKLHRLNRQDTTLADIYKLMIEFCTLKLKKKSKKIVINTSTYVANILRKNKPNISLTLIGAMLNLHNNNWNNWNSIVQNQSFDTSVQIKKLINYEVYTSLYFFVSNIIRDKVFQNIGLLLNYYYLVRV